MAPLTAPNGPSPTMSALFDAGPGAATGSTFVLNCVCPPLRANETEVDDQVTSIMVQRLTAAGSFELIVWLAVLTTSLRLAPMPTVQPSDEGSPCVTKLIWAF